MDKEQARFILRSFRPDGADAGDPDFAEALKLAMENRELGEWLASERAFDAAFASALVTVDLPEHLREDILACLATERGDFPQAEDGTRRRVDRRVRLDPAAAQPCGNRCSPPWTARRRRENAPVPVSIFRRLAIPLAAAAGIALAFLVTRPADPDGGGEEPRPCPIEVVQAGFVQDLRVALVRLGGKARGSSRADPASEGEGIALPRLPATRFAGCQGHRLPRVGDRWETRFARLFPDR